MSNRLREVLAHLAADVAAEASSAVVMFESIQDRQARIQLPLRQRERLRPDPDPALRARSTRSAAPATRSAATKALTSKAPGEGGNRQDLFETKSLIGARLSRGCPLGTLFKRGTTTLAPASPAPAGTIAARRTRVRSASSAVLSPAHTSFSTQALRTFQPRPHGRVSPTVHVDRAASSSRASLCSGRV